MFERLSRSWELVKASGSVLRHDKELLVFPLISSIAMLAVLAAFALPMFGTGMIDSAVRHGEYSVAHYVVGFLFYVAEYFVAFFFNAALVGAALIRLDGGNPTVRDGLSVAGSRAWNILGYAVIAATVGMILRAIEERVGFIGRIIVGLVGIGWSLATFLVVPVLVAHDVGPAAAVSESASLLKRTWGESVIGQGGIGLVSALVSLAVVLGGIGLIALAAAANSLAFAIAAAGALVVALLAVMLIHAAMSGIYAAALYRYATGNGASSGFDTDTLALAFRPK